MRERGSKSKPKQELSSQLSALRRNMAALRALTRPEGGLEGKPYRWSAAVGVARWAETAQEGWRYARELAV
jgi:hypothetical protein